MLPVILAIIELVSKLAGPFASLVQSVHTMWVDWHRSTGVTPDQLSNDAQGAAQALSTLGEDTAASINDVAKTLQAQHPSLDVAHAHAIAAMAVQHVAARRVKEVAAASAATAKA